MAITIHTTPQDFTPSDNPVVWTFSSDQTEQDNFVFLVEVYINDVLKANELVFPDNGNAGRFNAQSYASNACKAPVIPDIIFTDALNYAQVKIKVIERYGIPVADQAEATTSNVYTWKARLEDFDFIDFDSDDYSLPGVGKSFLSNFPDSVNRKVLNFGEQQRIMAITNSQSGLSFNIQLYDENNVLIAEELAIDIDEFFPITIFNLSPEQIVSFTTITQANFDAAHYYEFQMSTGYGRVRIDIDKDCTYKHKRRIHFLSEIGSIESFTFGLISRQSAKIKSYGYRKMFGEWQGNNFFFIKQQGRDIDYAKYSDRMITIESDWLTEDVQHWLIRNLYESPLVFEELETSGGENSTILVRRKITNTAWADKYNLNDTLFKEQITLMLPSKTSMIL